MTEKQVQSTVQDDLRAALVAVAEALPVVALHRAEERQAKQCAARKCREQREAWCQQVHWEPPVPQEQTKTGRC